MVSLKMEGCVDNVICVKCGSVIDLHRWNHETTARYMCYRCHTAKTDICVEGMDPNEVIKSIEKVNACKITDYYTLRNRERAMSTQFYSACG